MVSETPVAEAQAQVEGLNIEYLKELIRDFKERDCSMLVFDREVLSIDKAFYYSMSSIDYSKTNDFILPSYAKTQKIKSVYSGRPFETFEDTYKVENADWIIKINIDITKGESCDVHIYCEAISKEKAKLLRKIVEDLIETVPFSLEKAARGAVARLTFDLLFYIAPASKAEAVIEKIKNMTYQDPNSFFELHQMLDPMNNVGCVLQNIASAFNSIQEYETAKKIKELVNIIDEILNSVWKFERTKENFEKAKEELVEKLNEFIERYEEFYHFFECKYFPRLCRNDP